jgi:hypothetical protein
MTAFGARFASCNQTAWSNGSNKKARFAPALFASVQTGFMCGESWSGGGQVRLFHHSL